MGAGMRKAEAIGDKIHSASGSGKLAEVKSLIAEAERRGGKELVRAAVNKSTPDGCTALICAVYNKQKEVAQVLIDAGADPRKGDEYGYDPFYHACAVGRLDILEVLLRVPGEIDINAAPNNTKSTMLLTAAAKPAPDLVKFLIDRGADVNKPGCIGETPLLVATQNGRLENVKLLLAAGADWKKADVNGFTPMSQARCPNSYTSGADLSPETREAIVALLQAKIDEEERPAREAAEKKKKAEEDERARVEAEKERARVEEEERKRQAEAAVEERQRLKKEAEEHALRVEETRRQVSTLSGLRDWLVEHVPGTAEVLTREVVAKLQESGIDSESLMQLDQDGLQDLAKIGALFPAMLKLQEALK